VDAYCGNLDTKPHRGHGSTNKDTGLRARPFADYGCGRSVSLGRSAHRSLSQRGRGRNWKKVALSEKDPQLDVMTVTPDPKDPQTIYVGSHEGRCLQE
jgi:hypothetical protein